VGTWDPPQAGYQDQRFSSRVRPGPPVSHPACDPLAQQSPPGEPQGGAAVGTETWRPPLRPMGPLRVMI
jgi:hypothetical protein